jgi:hypothetical protein
LCSKVFFLQVSSLVMLYVWNRPCLCCIEHPLMSNTHRAQAWLLSGS